jgi:hypothetical protein
MSLDIKEIFRSDLDQADLTSWWSSKKLEKLNWNFTEILNSGGGPLGPQGFEGNIGQVGITGIQGAVGRIGRQGFQGVQGSRGYMTWLENSDSSKNNSTIKSLQTKVDPSTAIVGLHRTDTANYDNVFIADQEYGASFRAHTRGGTSQRNMVFISSDVDGTQTDLTLRELYYWDLIFNTGDVSCELNTGFQDTLNGNTRFKISSVAGSKYEFLTPKRTYNGTTWSSTTPTSLLSISATEFSPGPGITSFKSLFNGTENIFLDSIKISGNSLGNPNTNYIAHMHPDTVSTFGTGSAGTITWGSPGSVIGAFPIGTVIAIDNDFNDTHFDLNISGTNSASAYAAITGIGTPPFTPIFKFKYGTGKGKFKGWYLCNGRTWSKGAIAYRVPNLCGFDIQIDYPYQAAFGDPMASAVINISPTNFKTILGSSNIDISASFASGAYSITENSLESWEDAGEPSMVVKTYTGSSTLNLSEGVHDGLIYLVYLGDDGYEWDSSGSTTAPTLTEYNLGFSTASSAAACGDAPEMYKANFSTAWNDSDQWKTNGNKLYNSTGTELAPIGWYSRDGVSRFWNPYYESFRLADINTSSRELCPSNVSIDLVYNTSVLANGINGTFSSKTKTTKYIDTSTLSTSTAIYNDTAGTSDASSGWYRDANCRRYWNGAAFIGVTITSDYVHYIGDFGANYTSSTACSAFDANSLYYETSSSSSTSSTFYTVNNAFVSTSSSTGIGTLVYVQNGIYYSNGSVYRKGSNSSTGSLLSYVSCTTAPAPPPPSGGGGGGGCLLFGTKISLEDGTTKPIQEISVGDRLMSKGFIGMPSKEDSSLFNWSSADIKLQPDDVSVVSVRTFNVNVVYSFNDGKLFTSEDHMHLFKSNGNWKVGKTLEIEVGDYLLGYDGSEILISNIIRTHGQFLVYRLDVEDNDLFVANGILTHNLKESLTSGDSNDQTMQYMQ